MEQVFFGLNALGATPWVINRRLFDVVLQVRVPFPITPSELMTDLTVNSRVGVELRRTHGQDPARRIRRSAA